MNRRGQDCIQRLLLELHIGLQDVLLIAVLSLSSSMKRSNDVYLDEDVGQMKNPMPWALKNSTAVYHNAIGIIRAPNILTISSLANFPNMTDNLPPIPATKRMTRTTAPEQMKKATNNRMPIIKPNPPVSRVFERPCGINIG